MDESKISERVLKVADQIKSLKLSSRALRNYYNNIERDVSISDFEKEYLISAVESRARLTAPRIAKQIFGPKDGPGRKMLDNFFAELEEKFDLSNNEVRNGVKTGGDMISGRFHVSIYISYKNQISKEHVTYEYKQQTPTEPAFLRIRQFCTDKRANYDAVDINYTVDQECDARTEYLNRLKAIIGQHD